MSCAACREAVSADLDGESPGAPQTWVDEHLGRCPACRGWAEAAAEVTRRARLTPVAAVPDVTAAVLGRLPAVQPAARSRAWLDGALRLALLAVGAGQLAVSLPALLGAGGAAAAPVHLAHETGAWNLGLAACFLGVAVLPRLAAGALPFLLPFTAVLAWVTVGDLGTGHVHPGRAVGHLLLLGGAVLVSWLALRNRGARTGPTGERVARPVTRWAVARGAEPGRWAERPAAPGWRAAGPAARAAVGVEGGGERAAA
ncbi:zf-HC2 domain-containing protein [Modestobacter sp. VKM Ac-2979]|uniref:zf-HC2 domain-containing protein n=1 Tax=unclassified Modestobacter TaxID=2643866 RepID=UPI0022AB6F0A|nr:MULTISPECIES: zf-HC2 domain-containing protein [unclassified Modestobacter]MCZ2813271.1 zf-HC2 domain-containing protein [Modestobacter sp. VKM Ac-2979]MCZ2842537.1 zf-HC2 domain-containing protein [Modestobacter sp. VKM Ac-2980]